MAHSASPGVPAEPTSNEELHRLAQHDFEAALTQDELNESEAQYNETWGVKRRITLLALSRSKADLVLNFGKQENGPDVLMEMIEHIYEFRDHLRNTIELTDTASARLLITCSTLLSTQGATA